MKKNNKKIQKKVGLALSGGFIRSTASIGVIEVLEENNIPIDSLSACSAGSAVAGAYCVGTLDKLKKRLVDGTRKDYFKIIFEPTVPKKGLLKGERNRKFFEEFVGDKTFEDLDKELILSVTDIKKMEEVNITQGGIGKAIQACTSVPGIFMPVEENGQSLVDGGNFNMIPSKVLYQKGADYVIAVYSSRDPHILTRLASKIFKPKSNTEEYDNSAGDEQNLNIFQLIWRASRLSIFNINNFYHHTYPYNILIKPDVSHIRRWDTQSAAYCIEQGRKAALDALPQIKKDLGIK